jgi:hypothetical protein
LRKFFFSVPEVNCKNLGKYAYYSQENYENRFVVPSTDFLAMTMLYYEPTTFTEVTYMCIDYPKLAAHLKTMTTLWVPYWVILMFIQPFRAFFGHLDMTLVWSD